MIYQHIQNSDSTRELSLVEQKKLQWAREKDEMARLGELFSQSTRKYEKTSIRTYYSSVELAKSPPFSSHPKNYENKYPVVDTDMQQHRLRSPSLPPIRQNGSHLPRLNTTTSEEETSGYASDSGNQCGSSPDIWKNDRGRSRYPGQIFQRDKFFPDDERFSTQKHSNPQSNKSFRHNFIHGQGQKSHHNLDAGHDTDFSTTTKSLGSPTSTSSIESHDLSMTDGSTAGFQKFKEERAKWGDHGVTIPSFYAPPPITSPGPCWLEKGLSDRRDSEDESVRSVSYIRGQNVPIDPNILEERESKRRKAMELQQAIKEQLREREEQRRIEEENRIREEQIAEERLRRQVEMEKARLEMDQRMAQEKMENERRKEELMKMAIKKAENEARLEKDKRKREKRSLYNEPLENYEEKIVLETNGSQHDFAKEQDIVPENIQQDHVEYEEENIVIGSPINLRRKSSRTKSSKSRPDENLRATISQPVPLSQTPPPIPQQHIENKEIPQNNATDIDGIALVLQTISPIMPVQPNAAQNDFFGLNNGFANLHLAFLLAQQQNQLTQQLHSISTTNSGVCLNSNQTKSKHDNCGNCHSYCCCNTKDNLMHSNVPAKCDVSTLTSESTDIISLPVNTELSLVKAIVRKIDVGTQTEEIEIDPQSCCTHRHHHELYVKEVVTTTSSVSGRNTQRKDDSQPSSEATTTTTTTTTTTIRPKKDKERGEKKIHEERPKWGVNRPPTQYVKASERDPFYVRNRRKKKRSMDDLRSEFNCDYKKTISRNVCTEILPIRTDHNGKIYLNLRESSCILKEAEIKVSPKFLQKKSERVINRRSLDEDADDDLTNSESK